MERELIDRVPIVHQLTAYSEQHAGHGAAGEMLSEVCGLVVSLLNGREVVRPEVESTTIIRRSTGCGSTYKVLNTCARCGSKAASKDSYCRGCGRQIKTTTE